jgi:hypothetical protein
MSRYRTMLAILATGIPAWPSVTHPPSGSFDWAPFLMVVAAFVVAPLLFGIRLNVRSVAALVLGGITLGFIGNGVGSIPAVCLGLIALALASPLLRGSRPRRSRTIVELPD